jgi:hypothetical protein
MAGEHVVGSPHIARRVLKERRLLEAPAPTLPSPVTDPTAVAAAPDEAVGADHLAGRLLVRGGAAASTHGHPITTLDFLTHRCVSRRQDGSSTSQLGWIPRRERRRA